MTNEEASPDVLAADDVRILAGHPTEEEIAAATAVLAMVATDNAHTGAEPLQPAQSAWQRSQRAIRGPVEPGRGRWRSFSG